MQTPLHSQLERAGAGFREHHGWEAADNFGSVDEEYRALKTAVGIVDLSFRGKLAVTGADRTDFIHRMVSNEVQALQPGEGNYCFYLNAQGHVLADLNLLVQPERLLIDCEPFVTRNLQESLERYIIMDDVALADLTPRLGTIGVEGPLGREVVSAVLGLAPPHMKALDHLAPETDPDFIVVRAAVTGEGFWLIAPVERLPALWEKLVEAARPLDGRPAGLAALDVVRIEAGIPLYGTDIEEQNLPQETGQFRALSFTKGCYPGQEIVERIRSRGQVKRKLVGLIAPGGEPMRAGMKVQAGGSDIGQVTSATYSPGLAKSIALAYVRREFGDPGKQVEVQGILAEVSPIPFPD